MAANGLFRPKHVQIGPGAVGLFGIETLPLFDRMIGINAPRKRITRAAPRGTDSSSLH